MPPSNPSGLSQNPDGIQAASPGLRYPATLGKDAYPTPLYPERVTARIRPGRNPVGVDQVWDRDPTQGSGVPQPWAN